MESWPPERTHSGSLRCAAKRTAAATSSSLAAYTTRAGARSLYIMLMMLVRLRALSYCREWLQGGGSEKG